MAALHRPALPVRGKLGLPAPFDRKASAKLVVAAAIGLVIGVAALQVNQFSRLTSTGYHINELNRKRAARQADNHELEAQVARLSSLARVEWEARVRMGLAPPGQKLYIDVNQPVPDRQTLPTRFLPQERPASVGAPIDTRHGPFWKRVLKLLPFF